MRIISQTKIKRYADALKPKEARAWNRESELWVQGTLEGKWKNPANVKAAFGVRADFVQVNSGKTVCVFDIANNLFRMITAIHYLENFPENGRVYILRILTHEEYDTNKWKEEL
jgi:mRNA interferase HigB